MRLGQLLRTPEQAKKAAALPLSLETEADSLDPPIS
jgi:hypothetical protein